MIYSLNNNDFLNQQVCMPPAHLYHWYDVNLRMKMLDIGTTKVAKMNEEAAVVLGAEILGEGMLKPQEEPNDIEVN